MSKMETKEIEAIKALVEFTWKQENMEKVTNEIRQHIEKITDEVKGRVEKRVISEIAKVVEERVVGEIKEDVRKRLKGEIKEEVGKITDDIRKEAEKRISKKREHTGLYLALGLSFASIGLGIAIAALAGLIS